MSKFQPSEKRVAVKRVESKRQTAGGLYIPDVAQEKQTIAEVVAVGRKVEGLEIGAHVVFGKYTGTEIVIDDVTLVVMAEEDILGVVRE